MKLTTGEIVFGKLYKFAVESNRIENIVDEKCHSIHAAALKKFLKAKLITADELQIFVSTIEPENGILRTQSNHRVWIGGHEAPSAVTAQFRLKNLLNEISKEVYNREPWECHNEYENIHPFIDGNGRSGRALWLWQMINQYNYDLRFNFLHMFYYQTLQNYQK